jgi:hypothetical protein
MFEGRNTEARRSSDKVAVLPCLNAFFSEGRGGKILSPLFRRRQALTAFRFPGCCSVCLLWL